MQLISYLAAIIVIIGKSSSSSSRLVRDALIFDWDTDSNNYTGNDLGKIAFYGHSWNVPRISIPALFGYTNFGTDELNQGSDTWFYCGHVTDTNNKEYSIMTFMARNAKTSTYALTLTIGSHESQQFYLSGPINPTFDDKNTFFCKKPKDEQYFLGIKYEADRAYYTLSADNTGILGMKGAQYRLFHESDTNNIGIDLYITDTCGTNMEMLYGNTLGFVVNPDPVTQSVDNCNDQYDNKCDDIPDGATYQVTQPILQVYNNKAQQSSITIDGKRIAIKSGEFWHDRQIYDYTLAKSSSEPLYVGTWMTLRLNQGINSDVYVYSLLHLWSNIWPVPVEDHMVWQSGTETGYPPISIQGNVLYPEPEKFDKYYSMNNGGKFLGEGDLTINILNTDNPDESPHWTSSETGITYSTAWKVDITVDYSFTVYVFAMLDKCEFTGIWECAAMIYADSERKNLISYGWVEQMGFN
eukprot:130058_1